MRALCRSMQPSVDRRSAVAQLLRNLSDRRCSCGGTCGSCSREKEKNEHDHRASCINHDLRAFSILSNNRCHAEEECEADDGKDHQGSGETTCNPDTGEMETTLTEHCAGDCVAQHEAVHRRDRGECCKRWKKCRDNAAGDPGKTGKCDDAWDKWFPTLSDWTECNAYTVEVTCLEKLIAKECGGATEAAIGAVEEAAEIVGDAIAGPAGGAAAHAIAGAAAAATLGGVTPECCKTLRKELEFAKKMKKKHCAKAKKTDCPFRSDGTII